MALATHPATSIHKGIQGICYTILLAFFLANPVSIFADTVYEDGEDGLSDRWIIYDTDPAGATVTNVPGASIQNNSRVIELNGAATANGYGLTDNGTNWHNNTESILQWSMRFNEYFYIYVAVQTDLGFRYLVYENRNTNDFTSTMYKRFALGATVADDLWQRFTRDLEADLETAEPGNTLFEVNGFYVRGSGRFDDIALLSAMPADLDSDLDGMPDADEVKGTDPNNPDTDGDGWLDGDEINAGFDPTDPTNPIDAAIPTIYEDGEDGTTNGWSVADNNPAGAIVRNIIDLLKGSVIETAGDTTNNAYYFVQDDNITKWQNKSQFLLDWSLRFNEFFYIYVDIQTDRGQRYITYLPSTFAPYASNGGQYLRFGLGSVDDNQWHNFSRDLQADLSALDPGNTIRAVNGFLVRGSGRFDDIRLRSTTADTDMDGLSDYDETNTYFTNPSMPDTDLDGWSDSEEISLGAGYDPLDPNLPLDATQPTNYMGAGSCNSWSVYDATPAGASVNCAPLTGEVALIGSGSSNGYKLLSGASGETQWQNRQQFLAQAEVDFNEYFAVYIHIQTNKGLRLMSYYAHDGYLAPVSNGLYVRSSLGSAVIGSGPQIIFMNLEDDLAIAEPGTIIEEVNRLYIRGSGLVNWFTLE